MFKKVLANRAFNQGRSSYTIGRHDSFHHYTVRIMCYSNKGGFRQGGVRRVTGVTDFDVMLPNSMMLNTFFEIGTVNTSSDASNKLEIARCLPIRYEGGYAEGLHSESASITAKWPGLTASLLDHKYAIDVDLLLDLNANCHIVDSESANSNGYFMNWVKQITF